MVTQIMRITGPSKAGRENMDTPPPNTYEAGNARKSVDEVWVAGGSIEEFSDDIQ